MFDIERSFTYGAEEGVYESVVAFGSEAGLLAAAVESRFDPVTQQDAEASRFVGSVLTDAHYLLIETDVENQIGTLDGSVEADDQDVLQLTGTTEAPVFLLPAGGSPTVAVQSDMAAVWEELWGMLGDGVVLLVVLENFFR